MRLLPPLSRATPLFAPLTRVRASLCPVDLRERPSNAWVSGAKCGWVGAWTLGVGVGVGVGVSAGPGAGVEGGSDVGAGVSGVRRGRRLR